MAKVIRTRSKPKNWGPGVFAGGAVAYAFLMLTGSLAWWMLLIALAVVPIVELILTGTTKTENTEIMKE